MPKNMALTPRAPSSYYNDLYPDSGACLDGFEQAMSRDSDLDQEEEDGCEGPEERRDMHHMYESDVKERGPNETLAYDNRETETVRESPQHVLAVVSRQLTQQTSDLCRTTNVRSPWPHCRQTKSTMLKRKKWRSCGITLSPSDQCKTGRGIQKCWRKVQHRCRDGRQERPWVNPLQKDNKRIRQALISRLSPL